MGARDVPGRVGDAGSAIADRARDGWDAVKYSSWRVRGGLVSAAIAVVVVVAVAVVVLLPDSDDETSTQVLRPVLVTNTDLPAPRWTGWTQKAIDAQPAPATKAAGVTAQPAECVPGGESQRAVQLLGVQGEPWAGTEFVSLSLQARATVMLAKNSLDVVRAVDEWIAQCSHATVTEGDNKASVDLKGLAVNAKSYRLAAARVVAQSVTPDVTNADVSSTAITAVGRAGDYVLSVALTIPGAVTKDAVSTLDTLWRAQAAKLVGYLQAGKLQ